MPLRRPDRRAWAERMCRKDPHFFEDLALQYPEYLWIACSDSRIPVGEARPGNEVPLPAQGRLRCPACAVAQVSQIVGLSPGEVLVQRNVGNQASHHDPNVMSSLEYAVQALQVRPRPVLCPPSTAAECSIRRRRRSTPTKRILGGGARGCSGRPPPPASHLQPGAAAAAPALSGACSAPPPPRRGRGPRPGTWGAAAPWQRRHAELGSTRRAGPQHRGVRPLRLRGGGRRAAPARRLPGPRQQLDLGHPGLLRRARRRAAARAQRSRAGGHVGGRWAAGAPLQRARWARAPWAPLLLERLLAPAAAAAGCPPTDQAPQAAIRADSAPAPAPAPAPATARLCELNVQRQVFSVCTSPVVQAAWAAGQEVAVYGVVYDPNDGLLRKVAGPVRWACLGAWPHAAPLRLLPSGAWSLEGRPAAWGGPGALLMGCALHSRGGDGWVRIPAVSGGPVTATSSSQAGGCSCGAAAGACA
jgi:carbonic anhydrase